VEEEYEEYVVRQLDHYRASSRLLVGVCLNLHAAQFHHLSAAERIAWLTTSTRLTLAELVRRRPECLPVILSHDYRGECNDLALGMRLQAECEEHGQEVVLVASEVSAPAVKMICSRLEVLMTGRMHCGIAALGVGVPTLFFDYQGKVKGLLELFELSILCEPDSDPQVTAAAAADSLQDLLDHHRQYRDKILRVLPLIQSMSRRNVVTAADTSIPL
jgi:polysaccharide pyruvyl transferase WcaK-like protein